MNRTPLRRHRSLTTARRSVAVSLAAALLLPLAALPAQAAAPAGDAGPPALPSATPADELPPPSTTTVGTIRADAAWDDGVTGAGVGVALIDTGVAPTAALPEGSPSQVSLAGPGRADGDGHGTFMAGLIAGGEGPDGPIGVAPDAPLWSVKVADDTGNTSLDQLLAGLELVRSSADALGIRVVVLALGGPVDEVADPLEAALEQLWADGLVVVVGSGNDGDLAAPGVSPYLITVGAIDDGGTVGWDDDVAVEWSGAGLGRDGRPKPDVLAPGTSVVSYRAPGSVADRENPGSRIEGRFFRGTGTSMSAATTAGAAALVLQAEPDLTPDEVKGRLVAASRPIDGSHAGVLDVVAALDHAAPAANSHLPELDPTAGPLGADNADWIGRSWVGRSWVDQDWVGRSWVGRSWVGRSWVGRSWVGRSWVGRSWVGRSWVDHEWVGRSWVGRSWV